MQKWLLRFLALAAVAVLVIAGAGVLVLRASLPDLDGTLVDHRVAGTAAIERDAGGVPVITARTVQTSRSQPVSCTARTATSRWT
jgi:penicillin amidase